MRKQERGNGGHPRPEDQAILTLFQRAQLLGNHALVRDVKIPRVEVFVRGIWIGVSRGGENGAIHPPGWRVNVGAGMNTKCG